MYLKNLILKYYIADCLNFKIEFLKKDERY